MGNQHHALLVPTLKNQMWHHCKPYWRASIKEQNLIIFDNTLKKASIVNNVEGD